MKQYVQTDLEADREVANTLADLILGGMLVTDDVIDQAAEDSGNGPSLARRPVRAARRRNPGSENRFRPGVPRVERVTRIEPALSARELCGSKPIAGLTRGSAYRKYPLLPPGHLANCTLIARRSWLQPAPTRCPLSLPRPFDSCIPSAAARAQYDPCGQPCHVRDNWSIRSTSDTRPFECGGRVASEIGMGTCAANGSSRDHASTPLAINAPRGPADYTHNQIKSDSMYS
jgi:hypothetical protein